MAQYFSKWVSFDYRNEYRSMNDTDTFKKAKVEKTDEFCIAVIPPNISEF
jgi:hypothetical protein